jgi:hypothetical protein
VDSGAGPDARGGSAADARAPGASDRFRWQLFYDRSFAAHVAVDSTGAAIVSGTFFDAKDITLGAFTLKSHGMADVMLSRVLPTGAVAWARGYGAAAEDYPVSFVLDAQDRIVLTGLYNGTGNIGGPDFPPFAGTAGRYDVYIAGLAANGDPRWSKTINTTADAFGGPGLSLDGSGNVLLPGYFLGTATIGGAPHVSSGARDAYLARYDEPDGAFGGAVTFGSTGDERATVALFTGTDVILLGTFHGSVTFPTTPAPTTLTSAGGADIFVARTSTSGVMTSAIAFGGSGDEGLEQARLDSAGNVVLAGTFNSPTLSVLGGPSLQTAGAADVFIARLSPSLQHQWSVRFGGGADDFVRDLAVGPGNMLAITGEFRNRMAIGKDTWNAARATDAGTSNIDLFVATLDAGGTPTWSFAAGGPAPDRGLGIAVDPSGALYLTAAFQSPVDLGGGKVLTPDAGQWASALVRYAP